MTKAYYRASSNIDGTNDVPWLMFAAGEADRVDSCYGQYLFTADESDGVHISDLEGALRVMLTDKLDEIISLGIVSDEVVVDELVSICNPVDIVDTAGIWDCADLVQIIYDEVLEPREITKVITSDGMIVFDPIHVKPVVIDD